MLQRHAEKRETPGDYISGPEALRILDVKPQTLYSYVSRKLIRRLSAPDSRTSFYNREDVERRKARSIARSGHGPAAASAIHWGEPVLTTSLTEITGDGPRYRDWLATDLARQNLPYEAVADYLWGGRKLRTSGKSTWTLSEQQSAIGQQLCKIVRLRPQLHIRQLLTEVAWLHGTERQPDRDEAPEKSLRSLIQDMAAAFGFLGPRASFSKLQPGEPIASGLARALGIEPHAAKLHALNAALVLVADHELTPATFAARMAASTRSDLSSCIAAAIQVQFGTALGLRCDRLEDLLDTVLRQGSSKPDRVLRSARVPHELGIPIYPHGDPRARMLVEHAIRIWSSSDGAEDVSKLHEMAVRERFTLDEGLVVLCRALGVERQVAGGILALGRTAGWGAHILEQRKEEFVIRPRGRFVAVRDDLDSGR